MKINKCKITEDWKKNLTFKCDDCGKEIIGIENIVDAGDKVVCSENCLHQAIADFTTWANGGINSVNKLKAKG